MTRIEIKPELLRWARERSGAEAAVLARRFPQLALWERQEASPTLKQLENFAKATHTPIGYLFLHEPPVERVPIPDFRTFGNARMGRPSPDLLDTIYLCQQRQEWYRSFARAEGEQQIDEAIASGKQFPAPNNVNPANGATRFVHPTTGRSVVIDNVTKELLHVGGDGFKY